jgi:hypothetical protein
MAKFCTMMTVLSVALFPCAPPLCRSCTFLPRLCTPSFVSSGATFLSVTLCLGTPSRCMGSVLVLTARFAPLGHRPVLLGGTPWWNAAGAASSISSSLSFFFKIKSATAQGAKIASNTLKVPQRSRIPNHLRPPDLCKSRQRCEV